MTARRADLSAGVEPFAAALAKENRVRVENPLCKRSHDNIRDNVASHNIEREPEHRLPALLLVFERKVFVQKIAAKTAEDVAEQGC